MIESRRIRWMGRVTRMVETTTRNVNRICVLSAQWCNSWDWRRAHRCDVGLTARVTANSVLNHPRSIRLCSEWARRDCITRFPTGTTVWTHKQNPCAFCCNRTSEWAASNGNYGVGFHILKSADCPLERWKKLTEDSEMLSTSSPWQ